MARTPEQVLASEIANLALKLGHLQSALERQLEETQRLANENADLKKKVEAMTQKDGQAVKEQAVAAPSAAGPSGKSAAQVN